MATATTTFDVEIAALIAELNHEDPTVSVTPSLAGQRIEVHSETGLERHECASFGCRSCAREINRPIWVI